MSKISFEIPHEYSNWEDFYFGGKRWELRWFKLSLTFKFEDENVAYDSMYNVAKQWLRWCRILVGENFYFFGEILRGRNGYTFGYEFVVDNQEMMSFGYSDQLKT